MNRTAVIALGSNQGDRRAHLERAVAELSGWLGDLRVSPAIETAPAPPSPAGDPLYLNAVAVGTTALGARELLNRLLAIERTGGRTRPHPGAPRTLDLDLILLGADIVQEPGLEVPHPRFRDRRFVLEPLVGLAPDLVDPVTGLTIRELLMRVPG